MFPDADPSAAYPGDAVQGNDMGFTDFKEFIHGQFPQDGGKTALYRYLPALGIEEYVLSAAFYPVQFIDVNHNKPSPAKQFQLCPWFKLQ